jgi:hypothetical protein
MSPGLHRQAGCGASGSEFKLDCGHLLLKLCAAFHNVVGVGLCLVFKHRDPLAKALPKFGRQVGRCNLHPHSK